MAVHKKIAIFTHFIEIILRWSLIKIKLKFLSQRYKTNQEGRGIAKWTLLELSLTRIQRVRSLNMYNGISDVLQSCVSNLTVSTCYYLIDIILRM